MSNVEVGALDTVPGFTAAFHHGAFSASDYSSAYSTVGAAATAGFVYSDTPAGTYSWGTLAAQVKERENPDFTANSTLHTDYSSTYGWTTNSGWVASADSQHDNSESNTVHGKLSINVITLFGEVIIRVVYRSTYPALLRIQYPSSQVIKSYNITSERMIRIHDFLAFGNYKGTTVRLGWTDWVGTNRDDLDSGCRLNGSTFRRIQRRIQNTSYESQLRLEVLVQRSTSDYAAIAAWKLYTLNSENNTVHDQSY